MENLSQNEIRVVQPHIRWSFLTLFLTLVYLNSTRCLTRNLTSTGNPRRSNPYKVSTIHCRTGFWFPKLLITGTDALRDNGAGSTGSSLGGSYKYPKRILLLLVPINTQKNLLLLLRNKWQFWNDIYCQEVLK